MNAHISKATMRETAQLFPLLPFSFLAIRRDSGKGLSRDQYRTVRVLLSYVLEKENRKKKRHFETTLTLAFLH